MVKKLQQIEIPMEEFEKMLVERVQSLPSKNLVYDTDIFIDEYKILLSPIKGKLSTQVVKAEQVAFLLEKSLKIAENVLEQVSILKAEDELKKGSTIH